MIGGVLSQDGIQWVFNPPAAPHMGGVWERLMRSCKKALDVVLWNQVLTDEVLLTAFAEVEWLVNSRPLTEVSSDVDDLEALTPNHPNSSSEEELSTYHPVSSSTRRCQVTNVGVKHK